MRFLTFALAVAVAALVAVSAAPAVSTAAASSRPAAVHALHSGTQLAFRLGGSRSRGFGYGYRSSRRSPYGYGYRAPRRGHGFLHGLFVGWLLSHFFGGGFPLFWLVLLLVAFLAFRRRPRRRGGFAG